MRQYNQNNSPIDRANPTQLFKLSELFIPDFQERLYSLFIKQG
jgi:hypothetical protein